MTSPQVSLLYRCPKNPDGMMPTENGLFCHTCSHEVVDFRNKTEAEIMSLIRASSRNTCGRFLPHQVYQPSDKSSLLKWAAAVLAAAGLVMSPAAPAKAQADEFGQENKSFEQKVNELDLSIQVTDSSGNALTGAVIMARSFGKVIGGAVTDTKGISRLKVKVSENTDSVTLIAKYPGCIDLHLDYTWELGEEITLELSELKWDTIYEAMGFVVLSPPPPPTPSPVHPSLPPLSSSEPEHAAPEPSVPKFGPVASGPVPAPMPQSEIPALDLLFNPKDFDYEVKGTKKQQP